MGVAAWRVALISLTSVYWLMIQSWEMFADFAFIYSAAVL